MADEFKNLVNEERLAYFKGKLENTYVKREKKTGSADQEKVLSDNNLTDELLEKIMNAGDSSFNGSYTALTDKPTLEGVTIEGAKMASDFHLVKDTDYATTEKAGIVKLDGDTLTAGTDGKISVADKFIDEDELEQELEELKEELKAKVTGVYHPQASVNFSELPSELTDAMIGNVYNIKDAFVTTDKFVEGTGLAYPAGTNVVVVKDNDVLKFDVFSGFVDLTPYAKTADFSICSEAQIDAMFE